MRRRRLAELACAALAACSSYRSVTDAPDAGQDATVDMPDGGGDAAQLLANPGFEDPGAVGCGPAWSGQYASLSRVDAGRTGAYACRVCQNGATPSTFGVYQVVELGGATYDLQAWAHEPSGDASAPDGGVALSFVYTLPDGGRKPTTTYASLTPSFEALQLVATDVPPDAAPYTVKMTSRYGGTNVGDCFVVDDFLLVAE